jgi:hypothetical protein
MGKLKQYSAKAYQQKGPPVARGYRTGLHQSPFPTYEEVLAAAAKTSFEPPKTEGPQSWRFGSGQAGDCHHVNAACFQEAGQCEKVWKGGAHLFLNLMTTIG